MVARVEALKDRIRRLKAKLEELKKSGAANKLSEADTKRLLIEELLSAVGWDMTSFAHVQREWRRRPTDEPVDFALKIDAQIRLLVEAKRLRASLSAKHVKQLLAYASGAGVKWCLLTNGNELRLYNSLAEEVAERKLLFELKIDQIDTAKGLPLDDFVEKLQLLSPESISAGRIDQVWESTYGVKNVAWALRHILSTQNAVLVNLVRRTLQPRGVKPSSKEVRQHLSNLEIEIFPKTTYKPPIEPGKEKPRMRATIGDLLRAGHIRPGDRFRSKYKGQEFWAVVQADGTLEYAGSRYRSPSAAGGAVIGYQCDGWYHWKYQDASGDWKPIAEIRFKITRRMR